MMRRVLALAVATVLLSAADDPAVYLKDPAQEARAKDLFHQIRCVQCQNESIYDSNAPIAGDLRARIREQIAAGRTDAEIKAWLVERYGDFILLKPRFNARNAILWITPFAIVGVGLGVIVLRRRRSEGEGAPEEERELTAEELAALERLQQTGKNSGPA